MILTLYTLIVYLLLEILVQSLKNTHYVTELLTNSVLRKQILSYPFILALHAMTSIKDIYIYIYICSI